MSKAKLPTWLFGACSLVLGFAGALMVLAAMSTASLHFGHCGPSSLSSAEQYCRRASQFLIAGYGVLLASMVLAAVAIWLWVVRRGRLQLLVQGGRADARRLTPALGAMLIFVLVVAAGIGLVLAAYLRRERPRDMTLKQVTAAIANALDLDGAGDHDEFDMFLGRPITDRHFESLRAEILGITQREGQPIPGRDFGPMAEAWLRRAHSELTKDGT